MKVIGFWAFFAMLVVSIASSAHAQQTGVQVQQCVLTIMQENNLSAGRLTNLVQGTPLRVYGDIHVLARGETLTTLCARVETLRAREQTLQKSLADEQSATKALRERVQELEKQNKLLEGSFWQQHFGVGWMLAIFFLGVSVVLFVWFRTKEQQEKRRWSHHNLVRS